MGILEIIYQTLYAHYGDQKWQANTPFEIIVGAILTQNTAWVNVEKALVQFEGDLSPDRIFSLPIEELQQIIRPAGYYKRKAEYLKAITEWFISYHCDIDFIKSQPLAKLRSELLKVRGVGNETADSILLYAFGLPSFVVDAYTIRFFRRFPIEVEMTYMEVKEFCEEKLPKDVELYKLFHALIVENCKEYCKRKMNCKACPLEEVCEKINS